MSPFFAGKYSSISYFNVLKEVIILEYKCIRKKFYEFMDYYVNIEKRYFQKINHFDICFKKVFLWSMIQQSSKEAEDVDKTLE